MTQELADKLINHYEGVVSKVEGMDSINHIKALLSRTGTVCGICNCASMVFYTDLYGSVWVNSFKWRKYPCHYASKRGVINALQFRIDRLKTFKSA